jgi:hypothetical protein
MYIIVQSLKARLILAAVSLAVFGIVYFAVIKPNNDRANTALRNGEKQFQQAINNAGKHGVTVPSGVVNLSSCLASAGTDQGRITACEAKFKP